MKPRIELTSDSRALVFAPHPDDETLGAGGLLQRAIEVKAAVRVVYVTDGDNNPWMQRMAERRWRIRAEDRARWGKVRRQEALQALAKLGASNECAEFLGYPDQGLTEILIHGKQPLTSQLAGLIEAWHPSLLVIPSAWDLHPDHSALSVLVRLACKQLPEPLRPQEIITYMIHSRGEAVGHRGIIELELTPKQRRRKQEAMLCHASQLWLGKGRWLRYITRFEHFLPAKEHEERFLHHPICRAVDEGAILRLHVKNRVTLGAFGSRALHMTCVSAGDEGGRFIQLSARIPAKTRWMDILDEDAGKALAKGRYLGGRSCGEIEIPKSAIQGAERLYAKIERSFGFFDEAGWIDVQVEHSSATDREPAADAGSQGKGDIYSKSRKNSSLRPFVCCVIPCYNVARHCAEVIQGTEAYADQVIVVDDGSTDGTSAILQQIAAQASERVRVIFHPANRGKGAALITGFRHALENVPFDLLVTLDGDRQHCPADIPRLVQTSIAENAELTIGERTATISVIPLRSRIGNAMATWVMRRIYPGGPGDTQSGFRAFKRSFIEEIVRRIRGGRYETEAYILMIALEAGKKIATVPIQSIYLEGNRSSHFRPLWDALRIFRAYLNFRRLISRKPGPGNSTYIDTV